MNECEALPAPRALLHLELVPAQMIESAPARIARVATAAPSLSGNCTHSRARPRQRSQPFPAKDAHDRFRVSAEVYLRGRATPRCRAQDEAHASQVASLQNER